MKCTRRSYQGRRQSYTLVELLVVMAIILFVAGLLIVMWPGMSSSVQSTRNADQIQAMLMIARQRAIRDRVPTGVRLQLTVPTSSFSNSTQLLYIQQPDTFYPPVVNGTTATLQSATGSPSTLTFTGVDFTGGQSIATDYTVQAGDYLEINGGGPLHNILYVFQTTLGLASDAVTLSNPTTNWRIIRQPRPIASEEPLVLSGSIIVDLTANHSKNVPLRSLATDGTSPPLVFREIMFAPGGNVMGIGTAGNDKILLWVRDGSLTDATAGEPVLVGVQVGTGFIGGYPVDVTQSGGDYYSNTRDPHASGL